MQGFQVLIPSPGQKNCPFVTIACEWNVSFTLKQLPHWHCGSNCVCTLCHIEKILNYSIQPNHWHLQEGKRQCEKTTVFYMPHCGKSLYNNLLFANWSPDRLCQLIIIGNSFSNIVQKLVLLDARFFCFKTIINLIVVNWKAYSRPL
jgi:hypothetical protein